MKASLALQCVIRDWIAGGKYRSLAKLAKKAGVGYSTVRRLERGDTEPQFSTIKKILEIALGNAEAVHSWVIEFMPEFSLQTETEAKLGTLHIPITASTSLLHVEIFREVSFGGKHETELSDRFGINSKAAIDTLVKSGVLQRSNGFITLTGRDLVIPTGAFVADCVRSNESKLTLNAPGNNATTTFIATDRDGALAFYELWKETEVKAASLRLKHGLDGGTYKIGFTSFMTTN